MKKSLTGYAKKEIRAIHGRSRRFNGLLKKVHAWVLLDMMGKHVNEIKERHRKGDKHYLIETGDLIVLSMELIKEAKQSPDAVLFKCYPRFHKKLLQLTKDLEDRRRAR